MVGKDKRCLDLACVSVSASRVRDVVRSASILTSFKTNTKSNEIEIVIRADRNITSGSASVVGKCIRRLDQANVKKDGEYKAG